MLFWRLSMIAVFAVSAALFVGLADPAPASSAPSAVPQTPATPAAASTPAAPAAGAVVLTSPYKNPSDQAKTMAEANKVVCRTETTTGSRLGAMRICMTNAQWAERSAHDREVLEGTQGRSYSQ